MAAYDLEKKNPYGTLGAIAFPGTDGYSRGLWDTHYNNWGPRVGMAYQAMPGLVLRGGFGVTYLPSNTGYFSGPNDYGSTSFGSGTNMIPYGATPNGRPAYRFTDTAMATESSVSVCEKRIRKIVHETSRLRSTTKCRSSHLGMPNLS